MDDKSALVTGNGSITFPPLLSLDVDTWQQIAAYLTREDLDVLWQSGARGIHAALFRHLTHVPRITVRLEQGYKKWPLWIPHCKSAKHFDIAAPRLSLFERMNLLHVKDDGVRGADCAEWKPGDWHDMMATWPTRTLESLTLDLSTDAAYALWLASSLLPYDDDDDVVNEVSSPLSVSSSAVERANGAKAPSPLRSQQQRRPPSALNALRLQFPHLTSLQVTATQNATDGRAYLELANWICSESSSSSSSHQQSSVDEEQCALTLKLDTMPFYTLHLLNLFEYRPNTASLMQYLPHTLTDLKLSFEESINDAVPVPVRMGYDGRRQNNTLSLITPIIVWDDATTPLPRHLVRLSLEGVPFHLLSPNVLASLLHLEELYLMFFDGQSSSRRPGDASLESTTTTPLSQLPSSVRVLNVGDANCARLLTCVKSIPTSNALTSLTVQKYQHYNRLRSDGNLSHFKPIVECIVSDVKFQHLEALYVWFDLAFMTNEHVPSLCGMERMSRLRAISICFLHPMLHDQWHEHLPLLAIDDKPPLRVVNGAHFWSQRFCVDHYCADANIANKVLPKLQLDVVDWYTSRPDVQLPANFAAHIHTVYMAHDHVRNEWQRYHELTRSLTHPGEGLNWVQSLRQLPNVKCLIMNNSCDMSPLRDLTCVLEAFILQDTHSTSYSESLFGFAQGCAWSSRLVNFTAWEYIKVKDVTRFMKSLPPTLEKLHVALIRNGDPIHLGAAKHKEHYRDYASASSPKERSKREIRFFPPRLQSCCLDNSTIYVTEATIRAMPSSLTTATFKYVLDVQFDPWTLLALPLHMAECTITSIFCSDSNVTDSTLRVPLHALWKRAPNPMCMSLELPIAYRQWN